MKRVKETGAGSIVWNTDFWAEYDDASSKFEFLRSRFCREDEIIEEDKGEKMSEGEDEVGEEGEDEGGEEGKEMDGGEYEVEDEGDDMDEEEDEVELKGKAMSKGEKAEMQNAYLETPKEVKYGTRRKRKRSCGTMQEWTQNPFPSW